MYLRQFTSEDDAAAHQLIRRERIELGIYRQLGRTVQASSRVNSGVRRKIECRHSFKESECCRVCSEISNEVLFMKLPKHCLWLSIILLCAVPATSAQENEQPQPAPKYRMELIYIFDDGSPEFIFVIGNGGFKSVASLKNYLSTLPAGSILEWSPGCRRIGNEPLLSSEQEMEDFKVFCAERHIHFVLLPSG